MAVKVKNRNCFANASSWNVTRRTLSHLYSLFWRIATARRRNAASGASWTPSGDLCWKFNNNPWKAYIFHVSLIGLQSSKIYFMFPFSGAVMISPYMQASSIYRAHLHPCSIPTHQNESPKLPALLLLLNSNVLSPFFPSPIPIPTPISTPFPPSSPTLLPPRCTISTALPLPPRPLHPLLFLSLQPLHQTLQIPQLVQK